MSVDRTRVEQLASEGDRGARRVLAALRRLSFELSGAQLGITVASIVLGFVGAPVVAKLLEPVWDAVPGVEVDQGSGASVVVALALVTVVQMVLGELVPKSWAVARPLPAARFAVWPMRAFAAVLGPLIAGLNGAANAVVRLLRVEPREELVAARSLEELALLIRASVEHGTVDAETLPLLTRTISFGEKDAGEALVPRVSVVGLPRTATVARLAEAALASGHSRILVYDEGGDLDDVVGAVHVKDAYRVPRHDWETTTIDGLVDEVTLVPETRGLESLLAELTARGRQLAVVVDEYGGMAGIVTLEDVVEEIVGEIEDEYDPVGQTGAAWGRWVVSGMARAEELHEQVGFELPEGDFETLGGFLLAELGRIPALRERVDHAGWVFEVVQMDGRRVDRVRVTPPPSRAGDES